MKVTTLAVAAALILSGCSKMAEAIIDNVPTDNSTDQYILYTISKGSHYSNGSSYRAFEGRELKFQVKFDSSAVYHTMDSRNQHDINKLFGFSDNNSDHHQYSARIGWRWSEGALRLFAYVYNEGRSSHKEISTVSLGKEISCSIRAEGGNYTFRVDDAEITMPRKSATASAKGYQLYPYFGGDETAPHPVNIWIRMLN